ncbi:hypothetical protein DH2020_047260 [Rehmannia glutinosa]|uniref:Bifunctional inhibitor/plant lipid transfer protein/seed storage helical domain-containing protein n=1 Tax=Rehmannia glutinosa TaxID=99300 RepID=A0ABR0U919_REHGL
MASKGVTSIALLVLFNLLFFTMVSSTHVPCPPPPKSSGGGGGGHKGGSPAKAKCPKDTLKLGVCANLLNDLVHLIVGTPPKTACCSLIGGLADLDAAVCLCTAIKANVLGINLNVPVSLSLLLNYCGKKFDARPLPSRTKKAPSGHVKPPSSKGKCPKDTLKLGVCAKLLNGLVSIVVGTPPKTPCCTLIHDLADLEAAVCLCTAIKANVLGVKLNSSLSLSLLLNYCGKKVPSGFECA